MEWDEEWNGTESEKVQKWMEELPQLGNVGNIGMTRYFWSSPRENIHLHQFCDASRNANAAVVFVD
jgi:hypothetical protein